MIISFTGMRPQKLGGFTLPNPTYIKICQETDKILKQYKPEKVLSGMALGYDSYAAYVALKNKIPFKAVIPFLGQEKMRPKESQKIYYSLLAKAESQIIVSQGEYAAYKMQIRNEYLVNNCDLLLACWDGSEGGTANCVKYAEKIGRQILKISPA